jgi:cell division protein FtsW (lipid II flippase)
MWDTKRQIIWLATGFIVGTFVLYHDSFDEDGTFSRSFFLFLEFLLLLIMSILFYVYSRKNRS